MRYPSGFAPGWLAVAIVVSVVGAVVEGVGVIYWTASTPLNLLGVIIFEDLIFAVAFTAAICTWAASGGDWAILGVADDEAECALLTRPRQSGRARITLAQLSLCIGFLNTVWAILGIYASPGFRTPPLVQGILLNCAALFVAPFSKLLLGDVKQYTQPAPLTAAAFIAASVVVSLVPLLAGEAERATGAEAEPAHGTSEGSAASTAAWVFIYIVSLIPGALVGVLEQMFLIRYWRPIIRLLWYTSLWELVFAVAFAWVDFVPWFGTSTSASDFGAQLAATFYCSIGAPAAGDAWGALTSTRDIGVGCTAHTAAAAWMTSLGFVVSYLGGAALNRESATFSYLSYIFVTMVISTIFLIPGVNPFPGNTPVWSVLLSLALSVVGVARWKSWELSTTSDLADQFGLKADAPPSTGAGAAPAARPPVGGGGAGGDDDALPPPHCGVGLWDAVREPLSQLASSSDDPQGNVARCRGDEDSAAASRHADCCLESPRLTQPCGAAVVDAAAEGHLPLSPPADASAAVTVAHAAPRVTQGSSQHAATIGRAGLLSSAA